MWDDSEEFHEEALNPLRLSPFKSDLLHESMHLYNRFARKSFWWNIMPEIFWCIYLGFERNFVDWTECILLDFWHQILLCTLSVLISYFKAVCVCVCVCVCLCGCVYVYVIFLCMCVHLYDIIYDRKRLVDMNESYIYRLRNYITKRATSPRIDRA